MRCPNTPFATRLSGSKKETELRIRSIFQWKKKRPPMWLFAALVAVMFGCLGLVSCQEKEVPQENTPPEEVTPVDWYGDFFANYQEEFERYAYDGETEYISGNRTIKLNVVPQNDIEALFLAEYDSESYQSVVIHSIDTLSREDFTSVGEWFGDETSAECFVQELNDLVKQHSLTQYAVACADVTYAYTPEFLALGPQDGDGRYQRLILAGKTAEDDTWKRYGLFMGEFCFGKPNTEQAILERAVLSELFTASNISDLVAILGDEANVASQLLLAPADEGQSFTAACFTARDGYELVISIWDAETGTIVGTPFRAANSGGIPKVELYDWEGEPRLIYTANGADQGITSGQAGEIALRDGEMTWLWPVEGDIRDISRDPSGQPYEDYLDYWEDHFALMLPGGVEIFTENEEYGFYEGSPQQWSAGEDAISYYLNSRTIIDSDREQIRAWLEEFCRDGNNGMDRKNDSASWRILAHERSGMYKKCTLLCVSEYDESIYLRAVLKLDHMRQEPLEVLDWEIGRATPEEIYAEAATYNRMATNRDRFIKEYVQTQFPEYEVYFMEALDEEVEPGKAAIKTIELLGRAPLDQETTAAAYRITVKTHLVSMHGTQGEYTVGVVLTSDNAILGGIKQPDGKSAEEIIASMRVQLTPEGKPLLIDYYEDVVLYNRVYFFGEEPGEPQEGDLRIDSVRYLGSELCFETVGEAYLVRTSIYTKGVESADTRPVTKWWPVDPDYYLVLGRDMDDELYEVRGDRYDIGSSLSNMIFEVSYGISDWEVTIRHDANPYPQPLGLGLWSDFALEFVREEPTVEILEGWEPIYQEGDYWDRYTCSGISALRYYNSTEDRHVAYTIEMTRDDFATQRGIRLGSTRDEVKVAYPELKSGDYWGKYPGEDYLWYCDDELDFGPAILFFFENDRVSKIVLNNMFN